MHRATPSGEPKFGARPRYAERYEEDDCINIHRQILKVGDNLPSIDRQPVNYIYTPIDTADRRTYH
jgi:hypothetical protein